MNVQKTHFRVIIDFYFHKSVRQVSLRPCHTQKTIKSIARHYRKFQLLIEQANLRNRSRDTSKYLLEQGQSRRALVTSDHYQQPEAQVGWAKSPSEHLRNV